ncbi:SIS domain-containing protein [Sodalis sp. RH19]|uniref:SIS domain-containing protein n=1 Tax=Sodalis sp. RH19 TaxID=3394334 RepID=UPI0039B4ED42
MLTPSEILIPFATGIEAQPNAVAITCAATGKWLATLDIAALRNSRLLFIGIGASHAVLATTVATLRAAGVYALRSDGDDLPDACPVLADWYIGVSQSGRSPEVVRALRHQPDARRRIAIVNQPDSPLARECGVPFCLGGLVDSGMSSVALMATAVALGMLSDAITGADHLADWQRLPQRLAALAAAAQPVVSRFAAPLAGVGCVDFTARASSLTAAEQGALFLREGPKIPAMAAGTRNYLHGMTDSVGNTAHVIIGGARETLLARQLTEFGVPILLITDGQDTAIAGVEIVSIPPMAPGPRALLEVLVMELLALALAEVWGSDIDAGVVKRLDTKLDQHGTLAEDKPS